MQQRHFDNRPPIRRLDPLSQTLNSSQPATDLRLRRRREAAEIIVQRAELLADEDRGLLEAVYSKGHTVQEVARLLGFSHPSQVRKLRKRVRRLVTRVSEPRFVFVMTSRAHWPRSRRRVGEQCMLRGDSMRGAAEHLGLTLHSVRQQCLRIDAMFEAAVDRALAERRSGPAA